MSIVALLESAPVGAGNLALSPPQAIVTRSAPRLSIKISRSSDFEGRQDVKIMTYSTAHGWTPLGRIEVTETSIDPFLRRVPLQDDVLRACAVKDGGTVTAGSITVTIDETYDRATDSGLLSTVESAGQVDPYPIYLTQPEGDDLYGGGGGGAAITEVILDGSAGVDAGGGAWTFALGSTPTRVIQVIYDGATMLRGATPGFTWAGGSSLTLRTPYSTMPALAKILVIKQ